MPVHFGDSASFSRSVDQGDRHVAFGPGIEIIGTSVRDTINPEVVVNPRARRRARHIVHVDEFEAEGMLSRRDDVVTPANAVDVTPANVVEVTVDNAEGEEQAEAETQDDIGAAAVGESSTIDDVVTPANVVEIIVENVEEGEEEHAEAATQDGVLAAATGESSTNEVQTNVGTTDRNRSLRPPAHFPPRGSSLHWRMGPQPVQATADCQPTIPLTPPPCYTPPEYQTDDDEDEELLRRDRVPGYLDDTPPPRYDVYDPREHDLDIILEDIFDGAAAWARQRRGEVVDAWNALTYNSPRGPGQQRER